jgi:predicted NAD-dependent protein-ADP-ribosyltransferase YbiA (DUF1768 family)
MATDLFKGKEPLLFFSGSKEDRGPVRTLSNFAPADFTVKIGGVYEDFTCIEVPYQLMFARELNLAEFDVANALRAQLVGERPKNHGLIAKKFMGKGSMALLLRPFFPSKAAAERFYDSAKARFHEYNIDLMRRLVEARFSQDEKSKRVLLGTMDRKLVHFTRQGGVWGHNGTKGDNMLGKMLQTFRDFLRAEGDASTIELSDD